jgi:hypothetical protein
MRCAQTPGPARGRYVQLEPQAAVQGPAACILSGCTCYSLGASSWRQGAERSELESPMGIGLTDRSATRGVHWERGKKQVPGTSSIGVGFTRT